jgi:TPR repeat protein
MSYFCHVLMLAALVMSSTVQANESTLVRACEKGHVESCASLGDRYAEIETRDGRRKARTYLDKACYLGDARSCFNAYVIYWKGDWGEANSTKAMEILSRSCDLNLALGCRRLGFNFQLSDENFKAFDALKKACDLGDLEGCYYLSGHYEEGKGIRQNAAMAIAVLKKSCDGDHSASCVSLGFMYIIGKLVAKDVTVAKTLFGKACDLRNESGCRQYAKINQGH